MKIQVTERATADLEDISQFISQDSTQAAEKVLERLKAAMQMLGEQPGLGHERKDVSSSQYRFWRVYSYLIVYVVREDVLHVLRVVHGARNISQMFASPRKSPPGPNNN